MLIAYGGGELPNVTQEQADDDSVFGAEINKADGFIINRAIDIISDIETPIGILNSGVNLFNAFVDTTISQDLLSQVQTDAPLNIRIKSNGLYEVQYNGDHNVNIDIVGNGSGDYAVNGTYSMVLVVLKNGSLISSDVVYLGSIDSETISTTFTFDYKRQINVEVNDVLTFGVTLRLNETTFSRSGMTTATITTTVESDTVTFNLQKQAQQLTAGGTVYLSAFLPEMTGDVFFKGIINMLNLYVNPNENDPTILEIETLDDFYIDSTEDWTKKIDFKEDVIVTPTINFATRNYLLKFKDDNDYWNTRYTTETNKKYGAFNIDSQSQYNNDTTLIELPFSAKCLVDVPNLSDEVTGLVMPSNIAIDNGVVKPFKGTSYIVYRGGLTSGTDWIHVDENGDPTTRGSYPYVGHTQTRAGGAFDLLFGVPDKVYYTVTNYPNVNLYQYHEQSITRIISKFGKQIECQMWLLPLDVNRLNLRKIKLIDGVKFYIQKISEYDAQQNVNTSIELIKI